MRKTIMGIAAMTLLLASCSKNEVTSNYPVNSDDSGIIGFASYTGSRATDNSLDSLQGAQDGFNVIAYHKESATENKFRFCSNYKYDATSGTEAWAWTGAENPLHSWPTYETTPTGTYPLTFISFYPTPTEFTNDFVYDADVAVEIGATAELQVDYLSAKQVVNNQPTTGKVQLAFNHILSKILFEVDVTAGYKANIASIKIVNVANQTGHTNQPKFNVVTGAWTNPLTTGITGATTYIYKDKATQSISAAKAKITGNSGSLMLLPQYGVAKWNGADFKTAATAVLADYKAAGTLDAAICTDWVANMTTKNATAWSNARIEVVYNLQATVDDAYIIGSSTQFVRVGYALDLVAAANAWKMGNQYTYTIKLGGSAVSGGILLDPFYTKEDGTPDPGPEKPIVNPGDPINNNPGKIGFDVGVSPWIEEAVLTEPAKPIV